MIANLPCAGRRIELHMTVRRFVCRAAHCCRKIFAERFGDGVIRPMARRTERMDCLVRHLGLALGGRPAACFADRLGLPVDWKTPRERAFLLPGVRLAPGHSASLEM